MGLVDRGKCKSTIVRIIVFAQIIVQDQVLDTALFLAFGFLLGFHRYGKARVRWQLDCSGLLTLVRYRSTDLQAGVGVKRNRDVT
jgi:hypothetical protein